MKILLFAISVLSTISNLFSISINVDDQSQEIIAARCYSKCLKTFIRYKSNLEEKNSKRKSRLINQTLGDDSFQTSFVDEIAHHLSVPQPMVKACLKDNENQCSKQCFKACVSMGDSSCQLNDIGCLLAGYYRREMSLEINQNDCPLVPNVEESALKSSTSECPKMCKLKSDCGSNQLCCNTDTCGPICLQIEVPILNLPKYTPKPTPSSTYSNIEFDWSETFSKHLKNEAPLVFILQTRTCFCSKIIDKFLTQWQTLILTHQLGAKLNALDNGTIYQFRLAAVSPKGTTGFGPVSENLPTVLYKPWPPLPPENFREHKWRITDDNLFSVEVVWDEPKNSNWGRYEYLLVWMIDHVSAQSEGVPLSSLTQFNKIILGTVNNTTIDNLKPSTTYKIEIVTRTISPGFWDIVSDPATMYVTSPATIPADHYSEGFNFDSNRKLCSCPEKKMNHSDLKIGVPVFENGDLQVTIYLGRYTDHNVSSSPEICINYSSENQFSNPNRSFKIYKQTSKITIASLLFNCRYSLDVNTSPNATYHMCFCTPPCQHTNLGKNCPKEVSDISVLLSPQNVKSSLLNYDTMTYTVSWDSIDNNYPMVRRKSGPDIVKYRVLWAPRKFEPVPLSHYNDIIGFDPIFDWDRSDVRIIPGNITRLLLSNLTKDQLYIVRVQSLALSDNGQLLESHPAAIFLPTHGYSEMYYKNSKACPTSDLPRIVIVLKLLQLFISIW